MNKKRYALGTIVGAAAGLIAGVLMAPKSGKDTRADLTSQADKLKRNAEDTLSELRDRKKDIAQRVKGK